MIGVINAFFNHPAAFTQLLQPGLIGKKIFPSVHFPGPYGPGGIRNQLIQS